MYEKLKELRESANMTQAELARKMGVSRSCISSWENGSRRPNTVQIGKYLLLFKLKNNFFNPTIMNESFEMGKCFDVTRLNCEGLKKLYEYYGELLKNEKYLKKY